MSYLQTVQEEKIVIVSLLNFSFAFENLEQKCFFASCEVGALKTK